jgi:hypothetical protein
MDQVFTGWAAVSVVLGLVDKVSLAIHALLSFTRGVGLRDISAYPNLLAIS